MVSQIQNQVRLPLSVALEVVLQGIRIRLGRSIVTLMGIVLGIAFLMSILTTQSLREGVKEETNTRAELDRMLSFLVVETGPVLNRTLGVIQVGPANSLEQRFIRRLQKEKVRGLNWTRIGTAPVTAGFPAGSTPQVDLNSVGKDAAAVIVIGEGALPAGLDINAVLGEARQKVVALTRRTHQAGTTSASVVLLERKPRPDEIQQLAVEAQRNHFRTIWIIVISLLVTVIGICNAMLMSVTERFREIGTMKCLGALSYFIRQQFFIEASLMGVVGSLIGILFGAIFTTIAFGSTYGMELTLSSLNLLELGGYGFFSLIAGVILSIVAAIYPANFASKMVPATALRSNV